VRRDGASSPDAALRELTVSVLERHHTPEGIVDVPLGGVDRVFARQADGSFVAGPPDYLEPTGDPPTYRVPVPAGEVYLVLRAGGFQYDLVVGAPDRVVADRATHGRPLRDLNVQPVAIAVDGALPWDVGDDLVVTCPALVTRAYLSSGDPAPGTSAITGTSQGWQGAATGGPLGGVRRAAREPRRRRRWPGRAVAAGRREAATARRVSRRARLPRRVALAARDREAAALARAAGARRRGAAVPVPGHARVRLRSRTLAVLLRQVPRSTLGS
jgi:hypothetical protein